MAVTAIVSARVATTGAPRAQRYGTEDAIELFSGMLFGWIRCRPQERMPAQGPDDLSVLFERIVHCKQNLMYTFWAIEAASQASNDGHKAARPSFRLGGKCRITSCKN